MFGKYVVIDIIDYCVIIFVELVSGVLFLNKVVVKKIYIIILL